MSTLPSTTSTRTAAMTARTDHEVLDNPVWHALRGPQSSMRGPFSTDQVAHFNPEIALFSGAERLDETAWRQLSALPVCALVRRDLSEPPPPGWIERFRDRLVQMVAGDLLPAPSTEIVRLGSADVHEMLALVKATEPGPFFPRTHEMGRYVGVRRDGRLIAMAGERLRVPGFVEVSAVCTDANARGEGLGTALTLDVAWSIRAGGDEAFLHVREGNTGALRLYQKLGFVVRRTLDVQVVQWSGPG